MKQSMVAAFFVALLGLGFGMAQANAATPSRSATPAVAVDASPLQGGSCGDNRCQPPEDCNTCPQDCGTCCGNFRCEPPEDCNSCPQDCPCG